MAKQYIILFVLSFLQSIFMAQAQQNYEAAWLEIDQLEIEGKVTTTLDKVKAIHKKAVSKKNDEQRLKASLFQWKFQQIIDEKSQVAILESIHQEIEQTSFPVKNILYSYLASFLESHYNDNYWRISQRTSTEAAALKDYRTWDVKTFSNEISSFYNKALENSTLLGSTAVDDFTALLVTVPISRKYKPTLYDIIAHKALSFYKNSRNSLQPKDAFLINDEAYFNPQKDFYTSTISTTDTASFQYQSLKIYQELERIHSQRKNKDAFIFNLLQRFEYVKNNWKGSDTDETYLKHVQNLQKTHAYDATDIALAEAYRALAFRKGDDNKYLHPEYNKKALQLINTIEEQSKDTKIIAKAKNLKSQILQKKLNWQTQSLYLPNEKQLAKLTFTNTEKATLHIYQVPFEFNIEELKPYHQKDSLAKDYLKKRKLVHSTTYSLPKKTDHNTYSTEVIVPQLPLGHYIFTLIADDDEKSWKYHQQSVSEIGFNKTVLKGKTRYQIVDRYTGAPISNTNIEIRHRDSYNRENSWSTHTKTTDSEGYFNQPQNDRHNSYQLVVQLDKDSLKIEDRNYRYRDHNNYANQNKKYQSKTLLFLDRSIYRPGQKVYYKAIAIAKENEVSSILSDKQININVQDVNGQSIFNKVVTTNEYGSVHGDFDLPKSGLTGNFHISASISKPRDRYRNQNAGVSFSVEEYKRPTFEVTFEPATKIFKLNDTVTVKGSAKAFFGGNITDATVTYSIKRTVRPLYWWWRSMPSNENGKQIDQGALTTDDQGNFTIKFLAETDSPEIENKVFNYEISAKVTDINGETREATQTIKVADKNLLADIVVDETLSSDTPSEVIIKTKDVNDNPIKTTGSLTAYKLKAPKRYLNARPWPSPDIQNIDLATFESTFAHIPYTNENDPKQWEKGASFCEHTFENTAEATFLLDEMKDWPAGKYLLVTKVTDPLTKASTENQKLITLTHKKQEIPADQQLFDFTVDYNPKNQSKATFKLSTSVEQLHTYLEVYDGNRLIHEETVTIKKGSKTLNISLPKLNYDKITAKVHYHIFNRFYSQQEVLDFSKTPIHLEIEKKHFTDKLVPGGKETWSFKLKSSDKKTFQAEGLASMYDASLDQFRPHSWNTNFGFSTYTPPAPTTQELNTLSTKSTYYNEFVNRIHLPHIPLEELNLYGFTFNKINSWEYRQYLSGLEFKVNFAKINEKDLLKNGLVRGVVINDNIPLPGVSVSIKGTKKGTITDFDGLFQLSVSNGDILKFSYTGFYSKEITINNKNRKLLIELKEDPNALDEVVVIGYGTQKKSALTGAAISKRSSKVLSRKGISKAVPAKSALQARVAGVALESDTVEDEAEYGIDQSSPEEIEIPIEDLKTIKTRENLNETAFFLPNLKTNKKGEIEFEFTSPEALTQWNLQLLAHTKQATWGKLNAEALTQKDLNIIPNAPRFLREGDQLLFSAKISNLSDNPLHGTALLEWTNPTNGEVVTSSLKQENETQNFAIAANGSTEVAWELDIPEGLGAIQYKIVAKAGNATDGQTAVIPVLTNRKLVTESIAMWVRPGETETYTLNNFDPNSTTQKPHQITLEYTSNPAWLAIKSLPYLMEFPHECSEQTFSRLYANTIATHIINSQPNIKKVFESWEANGSLQSPLEKNEALKQVLIAETPWLRAAQSETEQQKRLSELFEIRKMSRANERAINKLKQLQKSNGGFPWFSGGRANRYITRHVVSGFGHLERLGVLEQRSKTDRMLQKAIQFLDREWVKDFEEYKNRNKDVENFYKQTRLLHFAYARSYHINRFPLKGITKDIVEKALDYQTQHWQQRSLYEKGLLALTLHRFDNAPKTVNTIMTALTETAVQSKANGMYWKENKAGWYWYQSIISTQALLIEAFTETQQSSKHSKHIEALKLFLLKNKRTNRWDNTISTTDACYALLLNGNDWLSIENGVKITAPNAKTATFLKNIQEAMSTEEAGTGYFKTHWNADEIDESLKTIEVKNTGSVTNYGGYYWQYFENLDKIKVDDKGPLAIDKDLYLKTVTNKGTELKRITTETPLKRGDKVTVRLLIKSEDHLEYVHLKDMRASGFEPTKVLSGYEHKDRLWYYQSTKDVATHFFIDRMPKGNYVLEYDVIANQTGTFSNGITTLQCMYAPEFNSHSSGQRVEIK